MFNVKLAVLQV